MPPSSSSDTGTDELDYQGTATDDQAQATFSYDGDGGIPVGGLFQRALFAWRFRDVNLLISDLIQGDSRIMIYRDITAARSEGRSVPALRCRSVLRRRRRTAGVDLGRLHDDGPVPVLRLRRPLGGRFAVDAGAGPRARRGRELPPELGEGGGRRVRRIADATTSRTRRIRSSRPGASRSRRCSRDIDEAPPDLLAHFRYPENLFQIQAFEYTNYHVTDPERVLREAGLLGAPDRPRPVAEERSGA